MRGREQSKHPKPFFVLIAQRTASFVEEILQTAGELGEVQLW